MIADNARLTPPRCKKHTAYDDTRLTPHRCKKHTASFARSTGKFSSVPKTNNYMQILILAAEITAERFIFLSFKWQSAGFKAKNASIFCSAACSIWRLNHITPIIFLQYIFYHSAWYNISFFQHEPDAIALTHSHLLMWQFVDCHCYSHHYMHVKYKL